MTEPVRVPVAMEETERPRFGTTFIAAFAVVAVAVAGVLFWTLIATTNAFDSTVSYTGADGRVVVESTFDLAVAKFAIAALMAFGILTVLAGVIIELADMKLTTRSVGGTAELPAGQVGLESVSATGVAALGVAIGELFTALGSALKGLRASAALLLTGTAMMITAGLVAWNTIPDTDRSPTILVEPDATDPETTDDPAAGTTDPGVATTADAAPAFDTTEA